MHLDLPTKEPNEINTRKFHASDDFVIPTSTGMEIAVSFKFGRLIFSGSMMKILIHTGLIVLSLFVLVLDRLTTLGHAVWLFYYIVVILASFVVGRKWLIGLSVVCTIFIVIGLHISKVSPTPVVYAVENRLASIAVLWILTYALDRNRQLTLSLRKRTEDLTRANRDLESFSYSVSHDLKNPLIVISGFGQMLMDDAFTKLNEVEKDGLTRMVSESKRMNDIIIDLLRLSRIGVQELKFENVNLSKIAANSSEELKQRNPQPNIAFTIHPDMIAKGDAGLLRVLFDNLLGNAIKFTSKSDNPRIEIGCRELNAELVYFIRDNGVGFDMQKADKIFEPFMRLHSPRDFPGTGIGLSIVRKIIERHNGRIWAQSEVGKGATFYFTIGESAKMKRNIDWSF